jgi:alpha-tubulin suppressor-like RCC1 family protein
MRRTAVLLLLPVAAACGDGGTGPVENSTPANIAAAAAVLDSAIAWAPLGSVSVTVTDASSRPAAGAWVKFAVTSGGGSVAADSVQTNASGVAEVPWTLGEAGPQTLRASLAALPATQVSFSTRAVEARPQVTAGMRHTCALNAQGKAFCWGTDINGQVGNDAAREGRLAPTRVAGDRAYWSISAGAQHTCALALDGRVYCWGMGIDGQVGAGLSNDSPTPVAVDANMTFVELSSGGLHTCARNAASEMWCWGSNQYGQLGSAGASSSSPRKMQSQLTFARVSAGGYHTCGLTAAGAAYCWGYNSLGQLGDGTQTDRAAPVAVQAPALSVLTAGNSVTCGTSVPGTTYCWGEDNFEQLGNGGGGTTCMIAQFQHRCSTTPTAVEPAIGFVAVAPGVYHGCGLAAGRTAWCWGANDFGQLGSATATGWTASAVDQQQAYVQITTGQYHTCAINDGYRVQCWGGNNSGQLGDGTMEVRRTPTLIAGGSLPQG